MMWSDYTLYSGERSYATSSHSPQYCCFYFLAGSINSAGGWDLQSELGYYADSGSLLGNLLCCCLIVVFIAVFFRGMIVCLVTEIGLLF